MYNHNNNDVVFNTWESQPWLLNVGHHQAIIEILFSIYHVHVISMDNCTCTCMHM